MPDIDALEERLRTALTRLEYDWTVPAEIIGSPDYHELERTRLWGRSWVFLAHESEIPEPGDYVIRYIGDSQFIVTRDESGAFRAHFNSCRHRGMMLCRAEQGNTSHYRCPYHGWTYNNRGDLVGVPASRDAYGGKLRRQDWGLLPAPQLDDYRGLVFGCLDPDTEPLAEFLGDMRYYLDLILGRTDGGMRVAGPPQRWVVDANWKLGADNFVGDSYHLLTTHRSLIDLGFFPRDSKFAMYGEQIAAGRGHGLGLVSAPPGAELPPYLGLPEEIIVQLKRRLLPEQAAMLQRTSIIHGNVFPNLTVGDFLLPKDLRSAPTSFAALRLWRPLDAGRVELWSWCLTEREAPPEFVEASYQSYVRTFGSGGIIEHDDIENWRSQTRVLSGLFADRQHLNYQMGKGVLDLDKDWPGPGEAYNLEYAEAASRHFYGQWMRLLATGDNPLRPGAPLLTTGEEA